MHIGNLLLYVRSGFRLMRVAGTTDSRSFRSKLGAIQLAFTQKETNLGDPSMKVSNDSVKDLYHSLATFVKEAIYLPKSLSVVIRELQLAGITMTEDDVIFAFEATGSPVTSHEDLFERSPKEVDEIWRLLPEKLRERSATLQHSFLQHSENIYESLKIIERWFETARAAKTSDKVQECYPILKRDIVGRVIGEAARKLENAFEFAIFLLEKLAGSRTGVKDKQSILFQQVIPSTAIAALFLTVTNGNQLKSAANILDAQIQLSLETARSGDYFNESVMESFLFGCTRAIDYEHRLDVAQSYFRRYQDECLLKPKGTLVVTRVMHECLMYMAADLGKVDKHQNLRIEHNKKQSVYNAHTLALEGIVGNDQQHNEDSQYATHLIALARAGYIADIMPSLNVLLNNKISIPIHTFNIIVEEIGSLGKKKWEMLSASIHPNRASKGSMRDVGMSYPLLPPQYHNGFQMINDIIGLMKQFGLDLHKPASFTEYDKFRITSAMPRGTHEGFLTSIVEAYIRLGSATHTVLQSYFLESPAQYAIDAFCTLAHKSAIQLHENPYLLRSVVMLFLFRCFPQRHIPRHCDSDFDHVPTGSSVYKLPLHEEKIVQQLTKIIFHRALGVETLNQLDDLHRGPSVTPIHENHTCVKCTSQRFVFPTSRIIQELCVMQKPVILLPGLLAGMTNESFKDYLNSLHPSKHTLVIPFSFLACTYFENSLHNTMSFSQVIDSFHSTLNDKIWYVELKDEIIVRSYSRRRKASLDSSSLDVKTVCTLCSDYFVDGLSELLKSFHGGVPMPLIVYPEKRTSLTNSFDSNSQ